MMVVMSEPTEVIQRNHFEFRACQLRRKFLPNSLQDARTRFLLNPNGNGELSALLLLLRRDLVVGELPVRLALLVRTHMHDRSCFTPVYDNGDLGVWTLPLAACGTVLTFVEYAGGLRVDLPRRNLRNLNGLSPFFYKRVNPQSNNCLNLCLMTGRIHTQRLVLDLREEQWIIAGPFCACRTCTRRRQQIRVLCIEWCILQVEVNFTFDPFAKLSYCQRLGLYVPQYRTRAAMTWETFKDGPFLIPGLLCS
jgi:hypothetical protein